MYALCLLIGASSALLSFVATATFFVGVFAIISLTLPDLFDTNAKIFNFWTAVNQVVDVSEFAGTQVYSLRK